MKTAPKVIVCLIPLSCPSSSSRLLEACEHQIDETREYIPEGEIQDKPDKGKEGWSKRRQVSQPALNKPTWEVIYPDYYCGREYEFEICPEGLTRSNIKYAECVRNYYQCKVRKQQ